MISNFQTEKYNLLSTEPAYTLLQELPCGLDEEDLNILSSHKEISLKLYSNRLEKEDSNSDLNNYEPLVTFREKETTTPIDDEKSQNEDSLRTSESIIDDKDSDLKSDLDEEISKLSKEINEIENQEIIQIKTMNELNENKMEEIQESVLEELDD